MGLTQKLGTIPLAIQTDSSNNVGIGGAANASYKLAVTGASLFSSSVYVGSNISQLLPITTTNFQILTGCYYDGSNIIATATSGNRIINNSGNFQFNTFTGATIGGSVTDTERMRIDNAGFVGIATNNPSAFQSAARNLVIGSGVAENFGITIFSGSTTAGSIHFADEQTSGPASYRGYINYTHSTDSMQFGTLSSERMRITSGGSVGIGVTSPSSVLEANGDICVVGSGASLSWANRSGSGRFSWYAPNGNFTYLYNSGNIGQFSMASGVYTALSDVNKKKDFEDSTIGLEAILGLKPTLYRMKNADENSDKELGFIAQQVKEFIPQAYMEDGEGEDKFIGLSDRPIIAALVKAIQELNAKVTALENK